MIAAADPISSTYVRVRRPAAYFACIFFVRVPRQGACQPASEGLVAAPQLCMCGLGWSVAAALGALAARIGRDVTSSALGQGGVVTYQR